MSKAKPKLTVAALPLLLLAGLSTGCTQEQREMSAGDAAVDVYRNFFYHAKWKQTPKPMENHVEVVSLDHSVDFSAGDAGLSDQGRSSLHAFLRESSVVEADQIVLDGLRRADGTLDGLAAARIAAVQAELARSGLSAVVADAPASSLAAPGDKVAVLVKRVIVLPPDCNQDPPVPGERPDYYFSCSNVANLGHMVADPMDLARGRGGESADPTVSAAGIRRYRAGEIKAIKIESTE